MSLPLQKSLHSLSLSLFRTHLILDNESLTSLTTFLQSALEGFEFVPPNQHRTNPAERAIRTGKNHFLSVLSAAHISFPPNRWHALLPLTQLTLNHMRPFALDPSISAWRGTYGQPMDFAAHPIHPAGQLMVSHDPPPTPCLLGTARHQRVLPLPCPLELSLTQNFHPVYSRNPYN
jgi:hypothetical protein